MKLLNRICLKCLDDKNNRRFNVIIIVLMSILILISYTFYVTMNNYLEENITKNIKCRSFFLNYDINKESESEVKDKIINIDHIVDFFSDSEYRTVVNFSEFATPLTDGDINLYAANNDFLPKIINGSNQFSDNMIICPNKIVASLDNSVLFKMNKLDYVNTANYLNKEIIATYNSYDYSMEIPKVNNTYEDTFTIVGLYDGDNAYTDKNVCYATRETIMRINNLQFGNLSDNINVYSHPIVVIDDSKNIDDVQMRLSSLGYEIIPRAGFDDVMVDFINYTAIIILVISIIVYLILNKIYFKKNIKTNYSNIGILKSLGYTNYKITKIIFINSLLTIAVGVTISLVIYTIIYVITSIVLENINLVFNVFSLSYPLLFILIMIIILIVIAFVESVILYFKVKKSSTINVLNN